MANINYQSDFQVEVGLKGKNLEGIPFTLTFFTSLGSETYQAMYDGNEYINCKRLNATTILVTFNSHGMRPGQLKVKKEFHVSNLTYPDGVQTIVDVEALNIYLVTGKADTVDPIRATIYQTFLKPVKGIDYFTPEERMVFKREIIDILKADGELRSEVFNELKEDGVFFDSVVDTVEGRMRVDDAFVAHIVNSVYSSGTKAIIENEIIDRLKVDRVFMSDIAQIVREIM